MFVGVDVVMCSVIGIEVIVGIVGIYCIVVVVFMDVEVGLLYWL